MVKKKKVINKEEEDNENTEIRSVMSSEFSLTPESGATERIVHIAVNSIENIIKRDTITIIILVYHNDILLGESEPLKIEPDFREPPENHPIDFHHYLPIVSTGWSYIDGLVSTPLLFEVIEQVDVDTESQPISSGAGDGRKKERTKTTKKSTLSRDPKIIGVCNLDILPMLLGEKIVTERLILESPNQLSTTQGSSWMNLPMLTVTLTQDGSDLYPSDLQVNYLSVIVESIYNLPTSFTESFEYKASTVVYIDSEEPKPVLFDRGKISKYRDMEKTKRWKTLSSKYEGRAVLSKYKIDCDNENIKNSLEKKIDLKRILEEDKPRIEWNYMSRNLLLDPGQQAMKNNINKYKYWPFQFMIASNVSGDGKSKSKDNRPQLYQCYADLSELLYPGRTQTRVVAQLHTYDTSAMMEKTGLEKELFNTKISNETKKEKEKKGKSSTKVVSVNIPSVESEAVAASPLTNENGEAVFVVVQFELQQPLVASRTTEEMTQELHELLGPQDRLSPYPYTGDLAEEQYFHCIQKLVETITESYRDFNEESNNSTVSCSKNSSTVSGRYPYIPDEIDRFTQYLYDTGKYTAIQTTLKNKIVLLLDQKFKTKIYSRDTEEGQNVVSMAYLYLVEQMHVALNTKCGHKFDNETMSSDFEILSYYAEENHELGNIEEAKKNYIDLIMTRRKDPEAWLEYAIFLQKIREEDRALECCREAIKLDSRNKRALLMHGVILTEKEDFKSAEIFFKAITQFYSQFAEGWCVLHLFYHRIDYFQGVDLTIRVAEQCLKNEDRDTFDKDSVKREPLAWSTIHCPKDRIYLIVTVFLLKLNLFNFAGIALGKELALNGRSTPWLYFMAVHHYLLGRYDDALTHLKEAQNQHGMDYSISGLMGHCHFQLHNTEAAIECYEFASTFFNRPTNIHLIDIRLGNYYLELSEYGKAKKKFLSVCKTSPTASSWLGLGIACYNTLDLNDAETALTEANRLNHNNAEIWGYLCLLNMTLHRYEEFTECYRRMVKNDLQNAKVLLLVKNTMESLGLSSPMLVQATSENTKNKESLRESNVISKVS